MVAAGHLRYGIITTWAVALATEVHLRWVVVWFLITLASGLLRGYVESRLGADPRSKPLALVVVALSCAIWATAPLLAWFDGRNHGAMLAVILLCAGYVLVFTQMRSAVREAILVSLPYGVVALILIASLWGQPDFWTLVAGVPVLAGALLIKVVITRMKDDSLAAVHQQQEKLIEELELARDQATAASDAKSRFLAVISHELRTPMNGVLGAAQLLAAMELEERQQTYVSIIRESGDSLLSLLNDILDLTKVEAGRMDLVMDHIDAESLIKRAIGPFRAQAEAKGLAFVVDLDGQIPAVMRTDALRLGQIVQNLLGNAVKFTDIGEIRLTVRAQHVTDAQARLQFAVSDTGVGIAPEDLGRLFQPFSQVDESSTRRFGGTGLGLAIAERIAKALGGEIEVSSVPGVGSSFALTVPVDVTEWTGSVSEEVIDTSSPASTATAQRVLIVEDHPVNRLVLQAWLESMGHDCVAVENGEAGAAQALVERFDLIIMDVNMPVMDGLTATRLIRRSGINRETPIAILSASARPEDHNTGVAAGADAYLNKPVDFVALAEAVHASEGGRTALQTLFARSDRAA